MNSRINVAVFHEMQSPVVEAEAEANKSITRSLKAYAAACLFFPAIMELVMERRDKYDCLLSFFLIHRP